MKRLTVVALVACSAPKTPAPPTVGVDVEAIDRSIKPGDDFFGFANNAWLKTHEIPADRSSYGTGAIIYERTTKRVADLITEAAAHAAPGADAQKIGDYYASYMDEAGIESKGLAPLQPALAKIAAIADANQLAFVLGGTLRADVDVLNNTNYDTDNLFGLWVAQDLSDPSRYAPFLLQGGLGLPDRDYYLVESPQMHGIREAYVAHIATMLRLAGLDETRAPRIFELEKKIAQAHVPRIETDDVHKGNNHWHVAELIERAPGLNWTAYFASAGLTGQQDFVIWQPAAIVAMAALVSAEPLDTWKDYLRFHAIERASNVLPKAFVDEHFAFYGTVLAGTPKLRDRWKRAVDATSDALGEAVGKLYVERYFPPSEKARAEAMVANLIVAFGRRLDALAWLAPQTKAKAKAKLAALKVGVGYPDKWRDYSALEIIRGDALGNLERAQLFEYHRNLKKLGQPVDRGEWVMNPQLVNAVNLPAMNALNFPAAILQPPDFDPTHPLVMDYGATGATIGHEISHSFDDQGALFDATGRLANWWTPEDFAHFEASAAHLVTQYSAYQPFSDLHVNGALTLSENIADTAGLTAAYEAYRIAYHGHEAPAVAGLTGDQQFFISFAQSWRTKIREQALRQSILTNGHAPPQYRADTVRNLDAWYPAFGAAAGDALYLAPGDRVHMW